MTIIDAIWCSGCMNLKMLLLKKPTLSELWMSGSIFFHSCVVKEKERVFEEVMYPTNSGNIFGLSYQISVFDEGKIEKESLVTCF